MFLPRIEQEPSPGLDDTSQSQFLKECANGGQLQRQVSIVRIERVIIDCDRCAPVTKPSKNLERVFQAVMGKAIGVVAE